MKYLVAQHIVRIELEETVATEANLSSFNPFQIGDDEGKELFCVTVNDALKPYPKDSLRFVRETDPGNGSIVVFRHVVDGEDVGYQFIIHDIHNKACALLLADNDFTDCRCALRGNKAMVSYGLNTVMMLTYAFATARKDTLLVHASMVRRNGKAYAFIAKSGTGKSTQTANWLKVFPDCDLMNDDNPVFRVIDGKVIAFGSPWSGKTPCYRQVSAPLGGIAKIVRDKTNFLERMNPIESFTEVLAAISMMRSDIELFKGVSATTSSIVGNVPVYNLHCLPDEDSARVASKGMEDAV